MHDCLTCSVLPWFPRPCDVASPEYLLYGDTDVRVVWSPHAEWSAPLWRGGATPVTGTNSAEQASTQPAALFGTFDALPRPFLATLPAASNLGWAPALAVHGAPPSRPGIKPAEGDRPVDTRWVTDPRPGLARPDAARTCSGESASSLSGSGLQHGGNAFQVRRTRRLCAFS